MSYFFRTAQNTLETLKEILDDLDVVRKELGDSAVSAKICLFYDCSMILLGSIS